ALGQQSAGKHGERASAHGVPREILSCDEARGFDPVAAWVKRFTPVGQNAFVIWAELWLRAPWSRAGPHVTPQCDRPDAEPAVGAPSDELAVRAQRERITATEIAGAMRHDRDSLSGTRIPDAGARPFFGHKDAALRAELEVFRSVLTGVRAHSQLIGRPP